MAEEPAATLDQRRAGAPRGPDPARILVRTVRRRYRRDWPAIAVLAGLPVVMFVGPALLGQPVMSGDDTIQNFPLRVLAGAQLHQGHLPLLDPYLWAGAPLLGGWNAAAMYPLTFLFAVLPGTAAWTAGLAVTWWVAGLGTFAFLRASRLRPAASALGALSFAFAGAMSAQYVHFGLAAGLSWVPVALLATLRLAQRPARPGLALAGQLGWLAVLGGAVAMVILAGEPRAIDDALIMVAGYAGWRAGCLRRWPARVGYLGEVLAGLILGVAAGAVQWLPGMAAIGTSQRAGPSPALFAAGSLPAKWLMLGLVPDLLGGSGSFGSPVFVPAHTLTEVTSYVGLMPLAAACALPAARALTGRRRRWRRPEWRWARWRWPEWAIWYFLALAGVLLALGAHTPLGPLLAHLPFYGDQRLQSRNIVITDFALAVLFGYWADAWLAARPTGRRDAGVGAGAARLAAALPGLAAVGVVAAAFVARSGLARWLGARPGRPGPIEPWLLPFLVLGGLAAALAWYGPRLAPGRRAAALISLVAADLTVFTVLAVDVVAPGPGGSPPPSAVVSHPAAPARPVGDLLGWGRFALYDPGLIDGPELLAIGAPDTNALAATPSVQGYGSIVDARYAAGTGSHQVNGLGQNVLSPRAIGDGTLDQLSTTVLLTPADYLITPAGAGQPAAGAGAARPAAGARTVWPGQPATWYLAARLPVTSVSIPIRGGESAGRVAARVRLLTAAGATRWVPAVPEPGDRLSVRFPRPRAGVAVQVSVAGGSLAAGAAVIGVAGGRRYRADGVLQGALVPPRWRFSGFDGGFAVFRDTRARRPLTLRAAPGRPLAGARVRALGGPPAAPARAAVTSARGVTVVRAAAAIPGWTAIWQPAGRRAATTLPVRRAGLVQAVTVPPGRGVLTWSYHPPGALAGQWVSLAGLAILAALAGAAGALAARRRGPPGPGGRRGPPGPGRLRDLRRPARLGRLARLAPPGRAGLPGRAGPVELVMSTMIRVLSASRLARPGVAVTLSGLGLLLTMLVGATAPNNETVPVRLPLSHLLPPLAGHDVLAAALMYAGDILAGLGLAGLLWAHSRGWRPNPCHLLLASAAVVAVIVNLSPVGSSDTASYAAYGRIAARGGDPYLTSPQGAHDPAYLAIVGTRWKQQPSVYGPVATLIQAFAALLGGASPAVTIWVWMILNGLVFVGTGLVLLKTSDDPVRATLFWTANPVLIQQLVSGGHVDTFLAAAAVGCIQLARRMPTAWGDVAVGVLAGLACGIKANAALVAAGLAGPLLWRREWWRVTRMAAAAVATVAGCYSSYGLAAVRPLLGGLRLVDIVSPWRLFQLAGHAAGVSGTTLATVTSLLWPAGLVVIAWLVSRRIAADQPRELVTPFALTFAWILVAPWALAWYTATAWAALAQVPRNRMTRWLTLVTVVLALCMSRGGQSVVGR